MSEILLVLSLSKVSIVVERLLYRDISLEDKSVIFKIRSVTVSLLKSLINVSISPNVSNALPASPITDEM